MERAQAQELGKLPRCESHRLIDFERMDILTLETHPPQFVLAVSGTKPYRNMDVRLVPLVYIRQPEYWSIEVVGSLDGFGLPALAPYTVFLLLGGPGGTGTIGTRGIEVVGASDSVRRDVPADGAGPGELPPEIFKLWRHSFEEDTGDAEVYRPADFGFPLSFGRRGLDIRANGEFVLHALAPADGTVEVVGHWTATAPDRISVRLEGRPPLTLTVLSVDDEVLRVRRDTAGGG